MLSESRFRVVGFAPSLLRINEPSLRVFGRHGLRFEWSGIMAEGHEIKAIDERRIIAEDDFKNKFI